MKVMTNIADLKEGMGWKWNLASKWDICNYEFRLHTILVKFNFSLQSGHQIKYVHFVHYSPKFNCTCWPTHLLCQIVLFKGGNGRRRFTASYGFTTFDKDFSKFGINDVSEMTFSILFMLKKFRGSELTKILLGKRWDIWPAHILRDLDIDLWLAAISELPVLFMDDLVNKAPAALLETTVEGDKCCWSSFLAFDSSCALVKLTCTELWPSRVSDALNVFNLLGNIWWKWDAVFTGLCDEDPCLSLMLTFPIIFLSEVLSAILPFSFPVLYMLTWLLSSGDTSALIFWFWRPKGGTEELVCAVRSLISKHKQPQAFGSRSLSKQDRQWESQAQHFADWWQQLRLAGHTPVHD